MIQAAPIRAMLFGSDQCRAEGCIVRAAAPILETCRRLVAAGDDPARPLHCYDVLVLSVSSIAIGAQLRVRGSGVGFEITATATCPAAPPVRATALAGAP